MQSALYVALSAEVALDRHMKAVANNVANINTTGYRAEGTTFESVLSTTGRVPVAFSGSGQSFLSTKAGSVTSTGNPLDLAIRGEGWFAIQTPAGVRYSRDGRLTMTDMGDLMTVTGHPILDDGGAPMAVNPLGGEIHVAEDGSVSQGGNIVGALGLFEIAPSADLRRGHDGSIDAPVGGVQPVQDRVAAGVMQGYVEGANVSPVIELTRLIDIQRRFEQAATATSQMDSTLGQTIRDLGPVG